VKPAEGYTRTAIVLHWLLAALIVGNLAFGLSIVDLPVSPRKLRWFSWHKWLGVTVFALSALRLAWRLFHPPPPLPATMRPWERSAAHLSHGLLYVLFLAAPLTGWLFSSAAGFQTVYLGMFPIPDALPKDKSLAEALKLAHHAVNYALIAAIGVHVVAAFKHHLLDRDAVLVRMFGISSRDPTP
jgi:cytochrome b561